MTRELKDNIELIVKQSAGTIKEEVKPEFIHLCRKDFNYNPDMGCGKCIYKHVLKLYFKYIE